MDDLPIGTEKDPCNPFRILEGWAFLTGGSAPPPREHIVQFTPETSRWSSTKRKEIWCEDLGIDFTGFYSFFKSV